MVVKPQSHIPGIPGISWMTTVVNVVTVNS